MKQNNHDISNPTIGCKLGKAYSILISQLTNTLTEAGLDITAGEYLVLRALYSTDGLRQCEIAEVIGKDKAIVCRSVAALENRGYVNTTQESHKCRRVYLSQKAHEIKPKIMAVAQARHDALLDITTPQEIEVLLSILDKIILTQ